MVAPRPWIGCRFHAAARGRRRRRRAVAPPFERTSAIVGSTSQRSSIRSLEVVSATRAASLRKPASVHDASSTTECPEPERDPAAARAARRRCASVIAVPSRDLRRMPGRRRRPRVQTGESFPDDVRAEDAQSRRDARGSPRRSILPVPGAPPTSTHGRARGGGGRARARAAPAVGRAASRRPARTRRADTLARMRARKAT